MTVRCRMCQEKAVVSMRRHHTALCYPHYRSYIFRQVSKAIESFNMLNPSEEVLVCVSGGKDSLVLWYVLTEMGYRTRAFTIDLGIGDYSLRSKAKVIQMGKKLSQNPLVVSVEDRGIHIAETARIKHRPVCSVCGIVKRYFFNRTAYDIGIETIATGHNLDDEASRLFGNVLRWQSQYLSKQSPVLPKKSQKVPKKIKPLVRLTEREVAIFAILEGIDYILEECPFAKGATTIAHKLFLNQIEEKMPGVKQAFYFGFQEHLPKFAAPKDLSDRVGTCRICSQDSFEEVCAFCKLVGNGNPGGI